MEMKHIVCGPWTLQLFTVAGSVNRLQPEKRAIQAIVLNDNVWMLVKYKTRRYGMKLIRYISAMAALAASTQTLAGAPQDHQVITTEDLIELIAGNGS
jgi:hypothetical protein